MAQRHGIHWLPPASTLTALIVGVLLANGHHIFLPLVIRQYTGSARDCLIRFHKPLANRTPDSLAGTHASGPDYSIFGSNISQQQANVAGGTAFAFLVKAMRVYAATIAFLQYLWRHATSTKRAMTLQRLESLGHATDNVFVLFNLRLWRRHVVVLLLATSTWYGSFLTL